MAWQSFLMAEHIDGLGGWWVWIPQTLLQPLLQTLPFTWLVLNSVICIKTGKYSIFREFCKLFERIIKLEGVMGTYRLGVSGSKVHVALGLVDSVWSSSGFVDDWAFNPVESDANPRTPSRCQSIGDRQCHHYESVWRKSLNRKVVCKKPRKRNPACWCPHPEMPASTPSGMSSSQRQWRRFMFLNCQLLTLCLSVQLIHGPWGWEFYPNFPRYGNWVRMKLNDLLKIP